MRLKNLSPDVLRNRQNVLKARARKQRNQALRLESETREAEARGITVSELHHKRTLEMTATIKMQKLREEEARLKFEKELERRRRDFW